jgi:hypothetical protein
LATLHGLNLQPIDRSLFPTPTTTTADSWDRLVSAAAARDAQWTSQLIGMSTVVRHARDLADAATERSADEVMSHGDIDQLNIVLNPAGPVLCDWDVAAPWVTTHELVDTAISLATAKDFVIGRRVVAAYCRTARIEVHLEPCDLGPALMVGLDWVAFNVERALGPRQRTTEEIRLSEQLVPNLLVEFRAGVDIAERIPELLTY